MATVSQLLVSLHLDEFTGKLTLQKDQVRKGIFFKKGTPIFVDSNVIIDPAGKVYYLVNRKLLTNQFDIPIEKNLLKSGLYILRIRNNSGIHTARFIIN